MTVAEIAGAFQPVERAIHRYENILVGKSWWIGLERFDPLHLADYGTHGWTSHAVGLLYSMSLRAPHPVIELAGIGIEPDRTELDPRFVAR